MQTRLAAVDPSEASRGMAPNGGHGRPLVDEAWRAANPEPQEALFRAPTECPICFEADVDMDGPTNSSHSTSRSYGRAGSCFVHSATIGCGMAGERPYLDSPDMDDVDNQRLGPPRRAAAERSEKSGACRIGESLSPA
jgi:hypothetical protein